MVAMPALVWGEDDRKAGAGFDTPEALSDCGWLTSLIWVSVFMHANETR